MQSRALDKLIPADHPARAIWDLVEGLDLSPLCSNSGAGEADSGQNAVDPAILMALWLYAACDGVGSARALARLCEEHPVYQWLRAGVQLGDQALSGFRLAHAAWLDGWLTRNVAALLFDGRLSLQKGVKDGVRPKSSCEQRPS